MMGHPRPAVEADELFAPPQSEGKPRPRKCNPSSSEAQPAEAMDLEEAEIGGRAGQAAYATSRWIFGS